MRLVVVGGARVRGELGRGSQRRVLVVVCGVLACRFSSVRRGRMIAASSAARSASNCLPRKFENDDFAWPHRDGLMWPHFSSVVVDLDVA
jgi:hypothetical protein